MPTASEHYIAIWWLVHWSFMGGQFQRVQRKQVWVGGAVKGQCANVWEWVNGQSLTSHLTNDRSLQRWVFPGYRLQWHWQPNNNKQEIHKTQKLTLKQIKWPYWKHKITLKNDTEKTVANHGQVGTVISSRLDWIGLKTSHWHKMSSVKSNYILFLDISTDRKWIRITTDKSDWDEM